MCRFRRWIWGRAGCGSGLCWTSRQPVPSPTWPEEHGHTLRNGGRRPALNPVSTAPEPAPSACPFVRSESGRMGPRWTGPGGMTAPPSTWTCGNTRSSSWSLWTPRPAPIGVSTTSNSASTGVTLALRSRQTELKLLACTRLTAADCWTQPRWLVAKYRLDCRTWRGRS